MLGAAVPAVGSDAGAPGWVSRRPLSVSFPLWRVRLAVGFGEPGLVPGELVGAGAEGGEALVDAVAVGAGDGFAVGVDAAFVHLLALFEVGGLFQGFHEGHIDVVEVAAASAGARAGFGNMAVEFAANDALGSPDAVDELVDVHAGGDTHILHHMEEVLGGGHSGGAAVAAVGAAAEAADGAVQVKGILRAEDAHCGVGGGDSHIAAVVEVEAEVADFGPAFLDAGDAFLNLGRGAVAHGVAHRAAGDFDAGFVPEAVLVFQEGHQGVDGEFAEEVGAPGGVAADAGLGDAEFLGLGDDGGPAFHFLHLAAVGVAAGEDIAEVAGEAGVGIPLDGEGRRVGAGALDAAGVEGQGGVGDALPGGELVDDFVDAFHLGRPLGADEGTDDDALQAGVGEHIEEFDLVVNGDVGVLDLHSLAHSFLFIVDGGPLLGHRGAPVGGCGGRLWKVRRVRRLAGL